MSKVYGILAAGSQIIVTPTIPDAPLPDQNIVGTLAIHWTASMQGTFPVAGYQVFRNGLPYATSAVASFIDHAITPGPPALSYQIAAFDTQGNNSGIGPALVITPASAAVTPPSWSTIPAQSLQTNSAFTLELSASINNPSGRLLTYALASGSLPAGVTLNAATGRVSGTVTSTSTVTPTFSVSDGINPAVVSAAVTFSTQAPDTLAPPTPRGLVVIPSAGRNDLTWDSSSDPSFPNAVVSGMQDYRVRRGGSLIQTIPAAAAISLTFTGVDIGAVGVAGSSVQAANGVDWTVNGAGADIFGTVDAFHYLKAPVSGDWSIAKRLSAFTGGANSKAGLMFRESLAANASFVYVAFQGGDNAIVFFYRNGAGTAVVSQAFLTPFTMPIALKTARVGNLFSVYYSTDDNAWTLIGSVTIAMTSSYFAGVAVTSHNVAALAAASGTQLNASNAPALVFADTGLAAGSSNSYTVSARDRAGNESAVGTAVATTIPGGGTGIKFHSGHYLMYNYVQKPNLAGGINGPANPILSALASAGANVKGVMGFYYWKAIERLGQGQYDFAAIDQDIAYCKSIGKRYALLISPVNFSNNFNDGNCIPDYILNNVGVYGVGANGSNSGYWTYSGTSSGTYTAAVWRANVMTRLIALMTALGARYDSEPAFELISLFETSGIVPGGGSDFTVAGCMAQYQRWISGTVAAFPHTNVSAQNNFFAGGPNNTGDLVNFQAANRCGEGANDTFGLSALSIQEDLAYSWGQEALIGRLSAIQGISGYTTDYRGTMGSFPQIEEPELIGYQFQNRGAPFSGADLIAQGHNLAASHMFWTYVGSGPGNWASMLAAINANPTLSAVCPVHYGAFGGCNTQ